MKNRLREVRTAQGLTQVELAALSGVQRAAISRFETGEQDLTPHAMKRLTAALGVSGMFLMGLDDSPYRGVEKQKEAAV